MIQYFSFTFFPFLLLQHNFFLFRFQSHHRTSATKLRYLRTKLRLLQGTSFCSLTFISCSSKMKLPYSYCISMVSYPVQKLPYSYQMIQLPTVTVGLHLNYCMCIRVANLNLSSPKKARPCPKKSQIAVLRHI